MWSPPQDLLEVHTPGTARVPTLVSCSSKPSSTLKKREDLKLKKLKEARPPVCAENPGRNHRPDEVTWVSKLAPSSAKSTSQPPTCSSTSSTRQPVAKEWSAPQNGRGKYPWRASYRKGVLGQLQVKGPYLKANMRRQMFSTGLNEPNVRTPLDS